MLIHRKQDKKLKAKLLHVFKKKKISSYPYQVSDACLFQFLFKALQTDGHTDIFPMQA